MTSQKVPPMRRAILVLGLSIVFLLVPPVMAVDEYPAPGFFLGSLSEQSSWKEILATPGMRAELPFVAFGPTYVELSSVCVDGDMLAIADPRIDNGVRVSAAELRDQVLAAAPAGGYIAPPAGPLAAAAPTDLGSRVAMEFPVDVYQFTERGILRQSLYLFRKPWPIPVCPAR